MPACRVRAFTNGDERGRIDEEPLTRVVIAGGCVAALECLIALRAVETRTMHC